MKIQLNENELRGYIRSIINESMKGKEVFYLDIEDVNQQEYVEDMQYTSICYDADEAIEAAKHVADEYAYYDNVINVYVMAGEREMDNGDIYGEPYAIYCASNKDSRTTAMVRQEAGYSSPEVDYYASQMSNESIKRMVRKAVSEAFRRY